MAGDPPLIVLERTIVGILIALSLVINIETKYKGTIRKRAAAKVLQTVL